MKEKLCKLANWILRKYTEPTIAFGKDVYINGRTYELVRATSEFSPYEYSIINFEVVGK